MAKNTVDAGAGSARPQPEKPGRDWDVLIDAWWHRQFGNTWAAEDVRLWNRLQEAKEDLKELLRKEDMNHATI